MKLNGSDIIALRSEAARLYNLGFGVHWIKPNSKAPVESGWAAGTRQDLNTLSATIRPNFGLGVRLGAASQFTDGTYLANLDIDIKSDNPDHKREALDMVERLFPGLALTAATVVTGYGLRLFFRTREPVESRRLAGSSEKVKVLMPTAQVSREQTKAVEAGLLSQDELNSGFRVRPAWEVEIMGAGKQVVLPPSIHPDTKKPYQWGKCVTNIKDLPLVMALPDAAVKQPGASKAGDMLPAQAFNEVEIDYTDGRFSPAALKIIFGDDVDDRSAAAFSLSISMVKAGFSDDEILTVLTDRDTFIGEMAYEHRKTDNRYNAANWARSYCLKKAKKEADAAAAFRDEVIITAGGMSPEDSAAQSAQLIRPKDPEDWKSRITRSGKEGAGPPHGTLFNCLLILENVVSPQLIKRDIFAQREFFGTDAPFTNAKAGKAITDEDVVAIKVWFADKFRMDVSTGTIYEAITEIGNRNQIHPIRDQLLALPPWDGVPRINGWLQKHFQAEGLDIYLDEVFNKWLLGSITRTFEPGAKFDWMPILEGPQGIGKSVFGSMLFGDRYFTDWLPNLADKDAALGLVGRRCVEFAELDRMRRSEVETVKAFVSRQTDNVRPPYGRKSAEYPRGVVFFGTTNRETYLQDDTGNRRFCPIKVGRLDFGAMARDRDALWSEALFNYQMGFGGVLYLEGEADRIAKLIQSEKQVQDDSAIMADIILDWIEREQTRPKAERFPLDKFKIGVLFNPGGPLNIYKLDIKHQRLAGKALRELGFDCWKSDGLKYWRQNTGTEGTIEGPL